MQYRNTFIYLKQLIQDKKYTAFYMLEDEEYQEAIKKFNTDNREHIVKDETRVMYRGSKFKISNVVQDVFMDAVRYLGCAYIDREIK